MNQTRPIHCMLWAMVFGLVAAVGNSTATETTSQSGDPMYRALRQVSSLE